MLRLLTLIDDETELTQETEQVDTYRETLFPALIKTDELLEAARLPASRWHGSTSTDCTPTITTTTRSNPVRLPKLQLRRFAGDLTKWMGFWQSFEVAVNSNGDLSGVQKFNYLTSLSDGAAREAVAGLGH